MSIPGRRPVGLVSKNRRWAYIDGAVSYDDHDLERNYTSWKRYVRQRQQAGILSDEYHLIRYTPKINPMRPK